MGFEAFTADRLDFQLHDFTRLSWVNDGARDLWQPRMQRITTAWQEVEWRAVEAGIRRCALTVYAPETFVERAGVLALAELNAMPLEIQGLANYSYSATALAPQAGQPFGFRIVIGKPGDVAEFKRAYDAADNTKIGQMLGFPECCQAFFEDVWVQKAMVDTTWPMAAGTQETQASERSLQVTGQSEANILWRWMGVRAVPHLPCSFACRATVEFGRSLIQVGRDNGFDQEMDWLEEILSWPAEWSALHGIAEVKTPILKVSTRTDATAHKFTVQRLSDQVPEEAMKGLHFPYKTPKKPILTGSRHHKRGLDQAIAAQPALPAWYASDNGFTTKVAMDRAHQPIVQLAAQALGTTGGAVLDLGCGNGALLKKLGERVDGLEPYGVEIDPARVAHAGELLPEQGTKVVAASLFDLAAYWPQPRRFALALLMPGRLLEADADAAESLRARLAAACDQLLIYAYGDWLTRYGGLAELARRAGLEPMGTVLTTGGEVSACLARVAPSEP